MLVAATLLRQAARRSTVRPPTVLSRPAVALLLLALQYPLRDGLSVLLLDRYRRGAGRARTG